MPLDGASKTRPDHRGTATYPGPPWAQPGPSETPLRARVPPPQLLALGQEGHPLGLLPTLLSLNDNV